MPTYKSSGSITTGTKTFSTPTRPDLSDLTYSLNGGTITITVTGSPGDTTEETVTQTLTGFSEYSLSWSSDHAKFKITVDFSVTDTSATPTLSKVEVGSPGTEDDQNPNTDWSLSPGYHDRAANEYEGGGITLRHGD